MPQSDTLLVSTHLGFEDIHRIDHDIDEQNSDYLSRYSQSAPDSGGSIYSPLSARHNDVEDNDIQKTIDDSYYTLKKDAPITKTEQRLNDLGGRIVDPTSSNVFITEKGLFDDAVARNSDTIKVVEDGIRGFAESSKIVMKMLDEVAKVHPFIGVAVLAFKAVVTLELKRRANDKKVIALKAEMKDMMNVLLQLRYVKDSKLTFPDGTTLEGRMQELMKQIAKDITECGNLCDAYTKKSLVAKVFKGPIWEDRLAQYADVFTGRRKELELALSVHTTLGVDNANETLGDLRDDLRAVHQKLDMLLVFRKLETPQEKEIAKILSETKGGAKACIENDDTLQKLILIGRRKERSPKATSGLSTTVVIPSHGARPVAPLDPHVLVAVRNEVQEDLDKALSKNMQLFDRKLSVQKRQLVQELSAVVHREGDRIISAVASGSHDKLIDPDLHEIWKDMGWKGSVKARHFVLALHDYFVDKFQSYEEQQIINTPCSIASPLPSENGFNDTLSLNIVVTPPKVIADDRWALSYINVSHVQSILEAFDDDGSGFVSIKEANNFTTSRPNDWSLPHWIAYWAAGWHSITWEYSLRIAKTRQRMYDTLKNVLPANKSYIDQYLDSPSLSQIEMLCASIERCDDDIVQDDLLNEKIRPYMEEEEKRIEANLKLITYNVDAANTIALVVGPGRIERYIFPLLSILMKHHLQLIKLACEGIFKYNEMLEAGWSLTRVFYLVDERISNLTAIFKQRNEDVAARFGVVAFGMFRLLHDTESAISEMEEDRDILYDGDSEREETRESANPALNPAISWEGFIESEADLAAYEDMLPDEVVGTLKEPESGFPCIQGFWSGLYSYDYDDERIDGSVLISIQKSLEDGTFVGEGIDAIGKFSIKGEMFSSDKAATPGIKFTKAYLTSTVSWPYYGTLDITSSTIDGRWGTVEWGGVFQLRMAPVSSQRFRYSEDEFRENQALARWSFARSAVLHQVRRQMWSWSFFESRKDDRKRFIDLHQRRELSLSWSLDEKFDFEDEARELAKMETNLLPQDVRFYRSLATYALRRSIVHSNIICNSCEDTIVGARIICLECMAENFRYQVDLCYDCFAVETSDENFDHICTHPTVKVQKVHHRRDIGPLVRNARKAVERAQDFIRLRDELDNKHVSFDEGDESEGEICDGNCDHCNLVCIGCEVTVSPPFWYCICCDSDIFICDRCDANEISDWGREHNNTHSLVRCQERDEEPEGVDPSQIRIRDLENKLASLDDRFTRLERSMSDQETTLNLRFASLEQLLLRLVSKLSA